MADRIQFHFDEYVDPAITRGLCRHGIDVTTTVEARLRTSDDSQHLEFIQREGPASVTHDPDFPRYARRDDDHPRSPPTAAKEPADAHASQRGETEADAE